MEEALPKLTSKASDMLTMKRSALVQVNNMRKEKGSSSSTRHLFNCLFQSIDFGQPKTGTACRFRFCFLDIRKRTIQLKQVLFLVPQIGTQNVT